MWLNIQEQFVGNQEARVLILDAKFRTFVQGDRPQHLRIRKLKSMADGLADLGHPVEDRTLVLFVLQGLNERFQYMAALLKRQRPLSNFVTVRSDLELEEIDMSSKAPPEALVAASPSVSAHGHGASGPANSAATGSSSSAPRPNTNNKGKWRNNRGGGRGRGSPAPPAWSTTFNPMTGTFQVWPGWVTLLAF